MNYSVWLVSWRNFTFANIFTIFTSWNFQVNEVLSWIRCDMLIMACVSHMCLYSKLAASWFFSTLNSRALINPIQKVFYIKKTGTKRPQRMFLRGLRGFLPQEVFLLRVVFPSPKYISMVTYLVLCLSGEVDPNEPTWLRTQVETQPESWKTVINGFSTNRGDLRHTVDGWNSAPADMVNIPSFTEFYG